MEQQPSSQDQNPLPPPTPSPTVPGSGLPELPPRPEQGMYVSPQNSKKKWVILLIVLLLLVGGAAAYYFLVMKKEVKPATTVTPTPSTSLDMKELTGAHTVAYAFRAKATDPYAIYWRAVSGGDRTEVGPLGAKSYAPMYTTQMNKVAYATENENEGKAEKAVWNSTDGGKTYVKLLDLSATDQVTDMEYANDGQSLVVAVLPQSGKNTVKSINLSDKKSTTLFTSDKAGIFLVGYDPASSQALYYEGCYNCDGNNSNKLMLRSFKTNTAKILADAGTGSFVQTDVNGAFTEVLVAQSTLDAKAEGLGAEASPPYVIQRITMADGKKTTIATQGKAGETGADGFPHFPSALGYASDGTTPYYSDEKIVYVFKDGKASTLFEGDKKVLDVLYVSLTEAVVQTGNASDFVVSRFDIKSNKTTTILNGDTQTSVFGVTYK